MGCQILAASRDVIEDLRAFDFKTWPFLGFPIDLQPQTMALLTTCSGSSTVEEFVFEKHMGHGMW